MFNKEIFIKEDRKYQYSKRKHSVVQICEARQKQNGERRGEKQPSAAKASLWMDLEKPAVEHANSLNLLETDKTGT